VITPASSCPTPVSIIECLLRIAMMRKLERGELTSTAGAPE
jgi:hypothetical protein